MQPIPSKREHSYQEQRDIYAVERSDLYAPKPSMI